jgi:hypothetical protein
LDDEVVVYINPPDVTPEDENVLVDDEDLVDDESCDNVADINDLDDLLAPMEHDDIDDYVILGGDIDITPEEVHPKDIPTTLAGDKPFVIEEEIPRGMKVSGQVIMNQCGSLLNRNEKDITGYRSQKHFLQRIASVSHDTKVPLLYPEAMLFPSIFWSMVPKCGSLFGAITSGIMVKSGK